MEFTRRTVNRIRPFSMIPLINVVFLLLVFFLLAGKITEPDAVQVTYPTASSGAYVEESTIVLTLGTDGSLFINNDPLDTGDIEEAIADVLLQDPNAVITLKADAAVEASRMIGTLQTIRRAGGQNVSLVTERKPS